jgi:hypothetical protein
MYKPILTPRILVAKSTGAAAGFGQLPSPQPGGSTPNWTGWLRSSWLLLLLAGAMPAAWAQSGQESLQQVTRRTASGKNDSLAARVAAVPVAYARTAQILLNTYGDTPLTVPLAATDADAGGSIASYTVTVLPPAAAGVLKLNGTTTITTSTVITAANAGNLTFDPAAGYFGTAVFQYTAKDNSGSSSVAVTYGIPVSKAVCGAGIGQANLLSYYARTEGEDWKVNRSVTVDGVTITANPAGTPYISSAATTNILFVSDQTGSMPGKGLVWAEDYNSLAATTSSITLTFSRPLANFTLSMGDIDNGTGYIDQLTLQGYDASNNLVTIPSANVATGATNSYSGNVFTGTANSAASATTNVLATFPTAITRLVMTYRNTATTPADPASQLIVFPSLAWCAQADVQTTITNTQPRARAGTAVSYTVTTRNNGNTDVPTSVTPTLTLALPTVSGYTPNVLLNGVAAGAAYNSATGLLTLPAISNLAVGGSVANVVTFTMPPASAGGVNATSNFTSTATDPDAANNQRTTLTTQNSAPMANAVTNPTAILSSTTTPTAIASLNASDADAATGNTTIVSYTLASVPNPVTQGSLYVNGSATAATAGTTFAVPTSATAGAPGYQLTFVPVGTFAGNATFNYLATDDVGATSAAATYTIPVTAGADLATLISGPPTAAEGQTRSYRITTTNRSGAALTDVAVSVTLSNTPPFSSISVTNGSYNATTGVITFNPSALAAGASVVNAFTFVAQGTPASVTATASSSSASVPDQDLTNNSASTTATITPTGAAGIAAACATPGQDLSPTISSNPNSYYPAATAAQTVAMGATTLPVGVATGAATDIKAGDLLLVIQMQGADIDATNTDAYGDGQVGGSAFGNLNTNLSAGQYEYVKVLATAPTVPAASGGTIQLATALKNSYQNASATAAAGQRRFQVVRIPQYQNLTVSGTVAPSAWDGHTGGILALDVTGKLTFGAGAKLDASGKGFRGGAGQKLTGTSGVSATDYRATAPASAATTTGAHAMKGEGIAGTPRYVNTGTALLDTGVDGYPSGSAGRGAPGNAGGGGTDANPTPATTGNTQNSGGGGGGNGARGGHGGNSASTNLAIGGESGLPLGPVSSSRLILGGGGGAGVSNDGSGGGPSLGYASSGAAGGGIVLVRTGSIAGFGSIFANGADAGTAVVQDGSGGGGAGGSILVTANNTSTLGRVALAANGGNGGSNSASAAHGPGGGGGGGVILTNAAPGSVAVAGGSTGTTTGGAAYNAEAGTLGLVNTQISTSIANSTAGINCSVDVTAVATAPATAAAASTATVTAAFANNGGQVATSVSRTVTLASGNVFLPVTGVVATGSSSISTPDAVTGDVTITYPPLATLAAGASTPYNISYTVPGTASVTTTAAIATALAEPVADNNSSAVVTAITGNADVVTGISGLSTMNAGRPTSLYSVIYANNGPAPASNVRLTATLPPGVPLADVFFPDGIIYPYDPATGIITFPTVASLSNRDARFYRFNFIAPVLPEGSTATVQSNIYSDTPQPAPGPTTGADVAVVSATLNSVADVASSITPLAASVATGATGTFNVGFVNNGPSLSTGVIRRVLLPTALSNVVASNGGIYDPATGVVSYAASPDLAVGANASSVITFMAPTHGTVTATANMNDATIFSGQADNNQATATIMVTPVANVTTSLIGPATTVAGNPTTFTVLTANSGPTTTVAAAAAVVQTVQLPAGLTGVFVSNNGSYNATSGMVTFPAIPVLLSGATEENTVSFVAPATGFTATANVTTATAESNSSNLFTAPATTISPATTDQANLSSSITLSDKNVAPGAAETFTIVTGNNGPQAATGVVQEVSLPIGLTILSISGGGSYSPITGIASFPIGTLISGTSLTNTINLTAPAYGTISAIASVRSSTSDPVAGDNTSTANAEVNPLADVTTTLIAPSTASAGQLTTLTVNTLNNGPASATQVGQTVAIPAGLDVLQVTATGGGTYDPNSGLVTFPVISSLAANAVVTNTITFKAPAIKSTDSGAPKSIISQATVTSTTPDAVRSNNTVSVPMAVKWNSDVVVSVDGPAAPTLGNPATYVVSFVNNGPAEALNVTPQLRITTFLGTVVASGGGVYDQTTGIITFPTIANQAVGVTGAVTNTVTITVPDRPIVGAAGVANVTRATNDPILSNNAGGPIATVHPATATQVDLQTTITATNLANAPITVQQAGQPVVLTVTATNAGAVATELRERVSLPAGLSSVVVRDQTSTVLPGAYNAATGVVTFPSVASQAAGTSTTYQITMTDPGSDPLVATAIVDGVYSDPVAGNNLQSRSINIQPVADVSIRVSGPTQTLPNSVATYQVVARNEGPSPANSVTQTVQLPTGLSDVTISGGGSYNATSGRVTFPTIATQAVGGAGEVTSIISFTFPTTAQTLTATIASVTTEVAGGAANNASLVQTALANQPPVANARFNRLQSPVGNTAGALLLTSLNGLDIDGALASFTINTLPAAGTGVLALNGTPVGTGQLISLGDAAGLTFDPAVSFVGNAFFSYITTDNEGAASASALYTIAIGQDKASVYSSTPLKGGVDQYQNGDVIANVFDANGGTYNAVAAVADNGVRTASVSSGSLPEGVVLDATTGQVRVANRTLLVAGTYPVSVTTTDANGGITTQVVSLRIGDYPLPVELTRFDALAVEQNAQLSWTTAQERDNAGFQVERSFDGTRFEFLGFVTGAGTSSQVQHYSFVDTGVGRQHPGKVYYRLQQRDQDGKTSYSAVRVLTFAEVAGLTPSVSLYPNPAQAQTTLDLTQLPAAAYQVSIVDLTGRLVQAQTLTGGLSHSLEISRLTSGSYLVIIRNGSLKITQRLLKQ